MNIRHEQADKENDSVLLIKLFPLPMALSLGLEMSNLNYILVIITLIYRTWLSLIMKETDKVVMKKNKLISSVIINQSVLD